MSSRPRRDDPLAPEEPTRLVSWSLRIVLALMLAVAAFLVAGATTESRWYPVGWVGAALCLWFALRALRVGIWMDEREFVIRKVFRTHRVELAEIERFRSRADFLSPRYGYGEVWLVTRSGRTIGLGIVGIGSAESGLIVPSGQPVRHRYRRHRNGEVQGGVSAAACMALNAELRRRRGW